MSQNAKNSPRLRESPSTLSALIKGKRQEAGLTQKEMGLLVGVSLKALREIEQGRDDGVTVGSLKKILQYFGLSLRAGEDFGITKPSLGILNHDDLMLRLKSIKAALQKTYAISELKIFGSYARREAKETSDIDILLSSGRALSFKEIVSIEKVFENILGGKKVDIVLAGEIDPEILASAEKDFIDV